MTRALLVCLCLLLPALSSSSSRAEAIVSDLSESLVEINSSFTGTEIVVFGAITGTDAFATAAGRDIVVVIRGPESNFVIRRKALTAGIWINREEVEFRGVPGYYFVASTRALSDIAQPATLDRLEIGIDHLRFDLAGPRPEGEDDFRKALIRKRIQAGLYRERFGPEAIVITDYTLFQVRVALPAGTPVGNYTAQVYLFRDGTDVESRSIPLFVDKTGLERLLYNFAHQWPWIYGLAAVLISALAGWLASFLAQRR